MKAVTWCGKQNVKVERVDDPKIINSRDAIVRVTSTAICGSDLHLYNGYIPTMGKGDILGHEFMGEIVELGHDVHNLAVGDRVVVPFTISCGKCWFCEQTLWSLCDNSNPSPEKAEAMYGFAPSALFGYSHLFGGYAGGQAEYVRVPFADTGPIKVPDDLSDEQVLFLSDIFPTGYQAAEQCNIHKGDVVAIWGAGPVGQFAIRSAFMLGAARVIAIDHYVSRLSMAEQAGAETIDFSDEYVFDRIMDMTAGRGADAVIDAVGLESHGITPDALYDRLKAAAYAATDRPHALRQAIHCCRKGGTVSIPGVYGGLLDKFPLGAAFGKGLTFRMGQTHMHRYLQPLLDRIRNGDIDPTFVITHRFKLGEAPKAYDLFNENKTECIKVILKP
ncbi:zinc-dependent alcohol dehydrogenase [Phycisphaerales bacterium AB-hyl4]|uniref:Zinc-dependent alcohol dehydrogenase n=1 Tax=Natronomicrosphaera hydrolytica TaxID=3242702 RepID=A0ABV4U3S4_9BACT